MARRLNGEGCVYKKRGYWEARAIKGRNEYGETLYKYFSAKTQQAVIKKIRQFNVNNEDGNYKEPTKIILANWLDFWLKNYVIGKVKIKTRSDYESSIG